MPKDIEVEFPTKGKLVVTMKRLNTGELHRLQDEAADIKLVNGAPTARILTSVLRENGVLKSIFKAVDSTGNTVAISVNDLQSLDPIEFAKMHDAFEELNTTDVKKNS